MGNKHMIDSMISLIAKANLDFFPISIILPAIFAVYLILTILWSFLQPNAKSSAFLKAGLGVVYIYAGLTIMLGISEMGYSAIGGAITMWTFSVLLFGSIKRKKFIISFPKELDLKVLSLYFILHGLFLYPLVELLLGFRWPGIAFFGAECPTTILLIGLLIGSIHKVNKILMLLLSVFAFIWGGYVAISGAVFDWFYSLAGLAGIVMTLKYKKQ